ncbi:MAG: radical SAM protein [Bacillota bacterium]
MRCMLCPRRCGADRSRNPGDCGADDKARVALAALHRYEEPCISGARGSGAIFFSGCNLQCVFCQNHEISAAPVGIVCDAEALARQMLSLEQQGAHNINLVTPAPHVLLLHKAIPLARGQGLKIPIVYNTNAYELVETLRLLEGLIDVYLPDLKYVSGDLSSRYSGAQDYFAYAAPAILEMARQCGKLELDAEGMAARGVILRHLVLPGSVDETRRVLDAIADMLPLDTALSLMGQYVPMHRADFAPLDRRLTAREYRRAVEYCMDKGFENVLIQSLDSAKPDYTPEFTKM